MTRLWRKEGRDEGTQGNDSRGTGATNDADVEVGVGVGVEGRVEEHSKNIT